MEMRTPVIDFKPGWRDSVKMTWKYLEEDYRIIPTDDCATHIHISLTPQYTLDQLKRIASAIIYFEPAFEALVPDDRRGNLWCRSIWLEGPKFALQDKSRAQSIELVERAPNTMALLHLLHVIDDPRYAWNFWSLLSPKQTIEFRQPPACETADETLSWAELAVNFIQVSIKHGSAATLRLYPANAEGLRWYLGLVNERGVNEPDRLRGIWAGIYSPNAAMEPIYVPWGGDELRPKLEAKAAEDMRLIRRHPRFY
jgi:Putative amidoligase enzyme